MFLTKNIKSFLTLFVCLVVIIAAKSGFSDEIGYISGRNVDLKAIKEKEDIGLRFARQAYSIADRYPDMKEEKIRNSDELQGLLERKGDLKRLIHKAKIKLNHKKGKYINNPAMLKLAAEEYTKRIKEMQQELEEIEKRIPELSTKIEEVSLKLESREIMMEPIVDELSDFDSSLEDEIMDRFNTGAKLLDRNSREMPFF